MDFNMALEPNCGNIDINIQDELVVFLVGIGCCIAREKRIKRI